MSNKGLKIKEDVFGYWKKKEIELGNIITTYLTKNNLPYFVAESAVKNISNVECDLSKVSSDIQQFKQTELLEKEQMEI